MCLWNKKGLTYKEWMKEQEEEQERAKGIMELDAEQKARELEEQD